MIYTQLCKFLNKKFWEMRTLKLLFPPPSVHAVSGIQSDEENRTYCQHFASLLLINLHNKKYIRNPTITTKKEINYQPWQWLQCVPKGTQTIEHPVVFKKYAHGGMSIVVFPPTQVRGGK